MTYKLNVIKRLEAFANALDAADKHLVEDQFDGFVLLEISMEEEIVKSRLFSDAKFMDAQLAFLAAEKQAEKNRGLVVALVSTGAVGGIREAYPNFFADSTRFVDHLKGATSAYENFNPKSEITKFFAKLTS